MAMAIFCSFSSSFCPTFPHISLNKCFNSSFIRNAPLPRFPCKISTCKGKGLKVVGKVTTRNVIIAVSLPLSLIIANVIVSLKIGEQLDKKWYEELAIAEAKKNVDEVEEEEGEEEDDEEDDEDDEEDEKPIMPTPQTRNRPVREV